MTWFESLTGFPETSAQQVRANLQLDGQQLTSLVNNRSFDAGEFTTPTLGSLRQEIPLPSSGDFIQIDELVADVQSLHQNPRNANAVFQVASQFNCLEMAAPHMVPEDGVGIYQNDWTQGPACCICAGGGTIYRNYFVELDGLDGLAELKFDGLNKQIGQTSANQIDCLANISNHFNNAQQRHWTMQNGYCIPSSSGLSELEKQLSNFSESQLDEVRGKLMVGLQADTQVTIGDSPHRVTQVFCSALPIAYSNIAAQHWNHFPRLILDSTYEATFLIALRNFKKTGCPNLYLTLVGGGVFGNKLEWILSAIDRSLKLFANSGLDVKLVSYGGSKPEVARFASNQSKS